MRLTAHPPLAVGGLQVTSDEARLELAHARLWLRVRLPDASDRRDWHVHLVRSSTLEAEEAWTEIDVSRHALRRAGEASSWSEDRWRRLAADLERHLASMPVVLFREPGTGLVSEPGESRAQFRKRLSGILRPALLDRVRPTAGDGPADAREGGRGGRAASETAAELAAVLDGVLEVGGVSLLEAAVAGELGPLTAGDPSDLGARGGGDRMIRDGQPIVGPPWTREG